jgi:hypothetical protein
MLEQKMQIIYKCETRTGCNRFAFLTSQPWRRRLGYRKGYGIIYTCRKGGSWRAIRLLASSVGRCTKPDHAHLPRLRAVCAETCRVPLSQTKTVWVQKVRTEEDKDLQLRVSRLRDGGLSGERRREMQVMLDCVSGRKETQGKRAFVAAMQDVREADRKHGQEASGLLESMCIRVNKEGKD